MTDTKIMWQVWRESDMTEGRGGLRPTDIVFADKQEAWDSINDHGGVMGRRPGVNCYPMDKLEAAGVTRWQEYEDAVGFPGDYDVRPIEVKVHTVEAEPATAVSDLRDLLDELDAPDERTVIADLARMKNELEAT